MIELKYPENNSTVCLQTSMQKEFTQLGKEYLEGKMSVYSFRHQNPECTDISRPARVLFNWTLDDPMAVSVIEISEYEDFSEIFTSEITKNFYDGYNFEVGKTYYWRVRWHNEVSETFCFHTQNLLPRFMYCEGTINVRDVGGYMTEDGLRIKQGLVYRGAEIDMHVVPTSKGFYALKQVMKIKSEVDLRNEADGKVTESVLGKDVNYCFTPVGAYEYFAEESKRGHVKAVFDVFCEKENYPIYFHCLGGADRTGSIAFILEGLLGLDEESMLKDFEYTTISGYGVRSRNDENFSNMFEFFKKYGKTWKERMENYLVECGMTRESLQKIRDIMLEKP